MNTIRFRRAVSAVVSVGLMAALAACSDGDASDASSSEASTTTTVDDRWKEEAGAFCTAYEEAMRLGTRGVPRYGRERGQAA